MKHEVVSEMLKVEMCMCMICFWVVGKRAPNPLCNTTDMSSECVVKSEGGFNWELSKVVLYTLVTYCFTPQSITVISPARLLLG